MTRTGVGRGKLILFGEHAAVYGYPAIGTTLPCRTEISWTPVTRTADSLTPDEMGEDREIFLSLLNEMQKKTQFPQPGNGSIWNRVGNVPRSGGFGSSAALCVALSRIALDKPETGYDRDVHKMANHLEKIFHGTPSGIDTGMAADNGCSLWINSGGNLPERKSIDIPDWNLVYGAIPRVGTTAVSVGRIRNAVDNGDKSVIRNLRDLGDIADSFSRITSSAASESEVFRFPEKASELVNKAQDLLASLELSSPELDSLIRLAGDTGASGGKLSGGGLGGAFYLCASDKSDCERILNTLPEKLAANGIDLTVPLTPFNPTYL